jgi:hypothetical protein
MGTSSVSRYDRGTNSPSTVICETDPKSYVLHIDAEKIITYSDNVIYKAYYSGGPKEAIMTVNWDDGGQKTKVEYQITVGEFGFMCNGVMYSAACGKSFVPSGFKKIEVGGID